MQLPPVELAGYFPYLPKDGSMPEEERLQHMSTLYQESEKIRTRFALLMRNLQKDLEKNSKLEDTIYFMIVILKMTCLTVLVLACFSKKLLILCHSLTISC